MRADKIFEIPALDRTSSLVTTVSTSSTSSFVNSQQSTSTVTPASTVRLQEDVANFDQLNTDMSCQFNFGIGLCNDGEMSSKGKICHIARVWGIIEFHRDHVFFNISILLKTMVNLKKVYQVGEETCFSANLASPTSRSKWKATRIWKPNLS